MNEPQTEDTMVAALLREREGLVQRGLDDRVAQVDEQLRLRGYSPEGEQDASVSTQSECEPDTGASTDPAAKASTTPPADEPRTAAPKGRRARGAEQA